MESRQQRDAPSTQPSTHAHEHRVKPFPAGGAALARAAEQLGIHGFDLLPCITGRDERGLWVQGVDQHPNEIAHRLVAQGFYHDLVGVIREQNSRINESMAAKPATE